MEKMSLLLELIWAHLCMMIIRNLKEDIFILGERAAQRLYDTTLTVAAQYAINFTLSGKRFAVSLHYKGSNSFWFVNTVKVY